MKTVATSSIDLERLREVMGEPSFEEYHHRVEQARQVLGKRTVWHVNSTAQGGGVAELLMPMVGYARGFDIDFRWVVVEGDSEFFALTKRLHNNIHGRDDGGGPYREADRRCYNVVTEGNAARLRSLVQPGDFVVCHDPQTAGLVAALRDEDVYTIWRCHIGHDEPGECARQAWQFLLPYMDSARRFVFTRSSYVPEGLDRERVIIIPPSIDPTALKNAPLDPEMGRSILVHTGILEGPVNGPEPTFRRGDGSVGVIRHGADVIHLGRAPAPDRRLVVQVSRWDRLKDPVGVLRGFAEYLSRDHSSLVLAGPNVSAVADDPEGGEVLDEVFVAWRELPHDARRHVHIVCLPMADREENAAMVNALQRHATVLVQKSLYEGFGLTVTEAMWKTKPVIASAVGGIQDQITDGVHGLLLEDPSDLQSFADACGRLLEDDDLAARLARNGRAHVEENFLMTRHLMQYLDMFCGMINDANDAPST